MIPPANLQRQHDSAIKKEINGRREYGLHCIAFTAEFIYLHHSFLRALIGTMVSEETASSGQMTQTPVILGNSSRHSALMRMRHDLYMLLEGGQVEDGHLAVLFPRPLQTELTL